MCYMRHSSAQRDHYPGRGLVSQRSPQRLLWAGKARSKYARPYLAEMCLWPRHVHAAHALRWLSTKRVLPVMGSLVAGGRAVLRW